MADSASDGTRTPDKPVVSSGDTCVTPVKSTASSSSMYPDLMQFLATLHEAKQTDGQSVAARLEAKRKEREDHRVVAKNIAKDLKKLRQANSRSHKKTKGASVEELLQALSDRAAAVEKKTLASAANKK